MELLATAFKWSADDQGTWISALVKDGASGREFCKNYNPEKKYTVKIAEKKNRRSLDANAYMWVLCEKIAQSIQSTKEEIYRHHIREIGVFRQVEICDKAVDTLAYSWGLHGIGWIVEKVGETQHDGFSLVNLYYGSSTYNTRQMSRLIDNVVQDCQVLEIETMTPAEIDRLKEDWNARSG